MVVGGSVDQRQGLYSYVHGTWFTTRMRMHTRRAVLSNASALNIHSISFRRNSYRQRKALITRAIIFMSIIVLLGTKRHKS